MLARPHRVINDMLLIEDDDPIVIVIPLSAYKSVNRPFIDDAMSPFAGPDLPSNWEFVHVYDTSGDHVVSAGQEDP